LAKCAEFVNPACEPVDFVFDISGGKHHFIEADEAKELLRPLTKPGNSYRRICFSNNSFDIDVANVSPDSKLILIFLCCVSANI
jgi:Ran GTPase-activating protein 1